MKEVRVNHKDNRLSTFGESRMQKKEKSQELFQQTIPRGSQQELARV